jgi:hypothetical protein
VVDAPNSVAHPPRRLLLLAIQTANQALPSLADNAGNASAWTLVPSADVNNGGTAAVAGSIRAYLYYKWGTGDTLAKDQALMGDSGDHQYGQIFAFDDVDRSDPFGVVATSTQATTTSVVMPGCTTDQNNALACFFTYFSRDLASTANYSAQANAGLTSVTEQHDQTSAAGVGGGIGLTTGIKATAGATGNCTATGAVSQTMAHISVGLNPDASRAIIEQVDAEVWSITGTASDGSKAEIQQLEAELWYTQENSGRVYQLEAEVWYSHEASARLYQLEAEVWYKDSSGSGRRRSSLM